MMKKHLGNFGLIIVLSALLIAPLAGFKFVYLNSSDVPQVLSGKHVREEVVVKEEKKEREPVFFSPKNLIKLLKEKIQ